MFNPSKFVKHDDTTGNYYLLCDNASCAGYEKTRLVGKEGDTAGIDSIKQRIDQDTQLMSAAFDLHGVPKILISSAIKLDDAEQILEDYEIQPKIAFYKEDGTIKQRNEKWVFKNDQGDVCCTMLSATYVVNLQTQLHAILIYNR
ncbi:MAG: hypothetical protein COW24_00085 [Candidatus Kerfeldbacteria bacterium CG15_BIG_FIL_POST_REV_8_21_14_020_45_12]|uniref:Uncharacterized protein n=1 Tax=Candidatus Kerfeldbacteria bacterium CG15_BIG_FIL_POST_REV_8_21_14_020_45_12 TaxID=2014247 RepID=A0A2M7H5G3_9BACT|nr:MAG: hypothetical protein COW24_00085 [Candidatus Kerfeldbacteria bacterium CG15_BIG_FIL_POST_REV_8_21_14_020_45_12]